MTPEREPESRMESIGDIVARYIESYPGFSDAPIQHPLPFSVRVAAKRQARLARLRAEGKAEMHGGPWDGKAISRDVLTVGNRDGEYRFNLTRDRYEWHRFPSTGRRAA